MAMAENRKNTFSGEPAVPEGGAASRSAWLALFAASVSGFLFQVDLTGLASALPDIANSLGVTDQHQAWVIDIYSLALIFALPVAGPVADRYGRRRMFIGNGVLFGVASALCAGATSFTSLLAWRVLQGVAGAGLTSSSPALLAAAFPGKRRSWAFGVWGTVIGASMVVGPPLGALIAATAGWPWIFWLNLPLCLILVCLAWPLAETERVDASAPMDWFGPGLLAIVVASLAFELLSSIGFRGIAVGCGIVAAFAFWHVERRHPRPSFDFALFSSTRFLALCVTPIAASIGYWSLLVHLPQMMRGPMGLDASRSGLLLTALTVPMLLLPSLGARLAQAMPARWYFGGGLAVIGIGGLGLAKVSLDLSSPEAFWAVGAMLLLGGAGCALLNAQITAAAVSSVRVDRAATAAAMCVTMRQVGFAIGIALIGAALQLDAGKSYPSAYALVGVITLVLAALVFAMLSGPNPHEQR
jgi:MFS family permease